MFSPPHTRLQKHRWVFFSFPAIIALLIPIQILPVGECLTWCTSSFATLMPFRMGILESWHLHRFLSKRSNWSEDWPEPLTSNSASVSPSCFILRIDCCHLFPHDADTLFALIYANKQMPKSGWRWIGIPRPPITILNPLNQPEGLLNSCLLLLTINIISNNNHHPKWSERRSKDELRGNKLFTDGL